MVPVHLFQRCSICALWQPRATDNWEPKSSDLMSFLPILSACLYVSSAFAASGCGTKHDFAGQVHEGYNINSPSGGGERIYDVYLPPNYDENKKTPLILSFHGHGSSRERQRSLDQFNDTKINSDHIAVWALGLPGTDGQSAWQGPSYAQPGVSDKVFTSELIAQLRTAFCIDDSRIYAVGKSNGGGFVDTLACSPGHGGVFAAVAASSGAFYTDNVDGPEDKCEPARSSIPFLEFHGDADTTIPFNGGLGSGGSLPNIDHLLHRWGIRNGCAEDYNEEVKHTHDNFVRVSSWTCNGVESVRGYKVAELGHHWPSTSTNADNDGKPTVIDASPIILDFFRKHSKP